MSSRIYKDPTLKLFSLSSNRPLAEKVAEEVGIELGKINIQQFADGEIKVNIDESIRGDHIYLLQSTNYPVNDYLLELVITIDALKRASAGVIEVILPYYGYARADRKAQPREPITAKLVANMITKAGADRIISVDLHADQLQGFFDLPMDVLTAVRLFASYFDDNYIKNQEEDWVIVSPDYSSTTRARRLANLLDVPLAIVDDRPELNHQQVIGEVKGKNCILFDDIIDTANTMSRAADILDRFRAKRIIAAATHPVLSGPALDRVNASPIEKLIVTDTICLEEVCLDKGAIMDKVEIISVAPMLARAIVTVHEGGSMTDLRSEEDIPY